MIINPYVYATSGGAQPNSLANLELWLKADSIVGLNNQDQINTWSDSSINARNATGQADSGIKPRYGSASGPLAGPSVELNLNGSGGYFTLPNFMTGFTAGEAFMVVKCNADPASSSGTSAHPLSQWGSDATAAHYPFTDGVIYDDFGSTARLTTGNPSTSLATWHVYDVRSASASWIRSINGATAGADFFSTGTNTVGWGTTPQLGKDNGNLTLAYLAEVIFYSRILDDATERKPVIHVYLNTKYGFALPT